MNLFSRAGIPPGMTVTILKGVRMNMAFFNTEAYESLLRKIRISEEN